MLELQQREYWGEVLNFTLPRLFSPFRSPILTIIFILCILEALASRASLLSGKCAFHMHINQSELKLRTVSSIWLFYFKRQYSCALITPGPGTRQVGTTPTGQGQPKLFKLSNPKSARLLILPQPYTPWRTTIKTFAHASLLLRLPPDWPWCLLLWPYIAWHSLPLGNCKNHFSNGNHPLICWPYHTWIKRKSWLHFKIKSCQAASRQFANSFYPSVEE